MLEYRHTETKREELVMALKPNDVRKWAKVKGIPVGKRGRIIKETKVMYLKDHPREAREIAKEKGVDLPARGRLSYSQVSKLV
jgi:hypothetical protein